jgi:hypothetical protein
MAPRIRTLGIWCIVVGLLSAFTAWVVFDHLNGLTLGGDFVALPRLFVAAWMLFVIMLAVPYLIAGVGLIRFQPWARTLATITLTCGMVSFPIGTALGVYGLSLLMSPEVDETFSPRFNMGRPEQRPRADRSLLL